MSKSLSVNFNSQQLIEKFLKNGGSITYLPTIDPNKVKDAEGNSKKELTVSSAHRKELQLLSLPEAADLYGQKIVHKRKANTGDTDKLKDINKDLIPKELHHIFDKQN